MFKSIKSLLDESSLKQPIARGVRSAVILEAARDAVEFIFPGNIALKIQPISFKDGILTIGVTSQILIQELKIRHESIISLVNDNIGEKIVKQIKIKITRQEDPNMLGL